MLPPSEARTPRLVTSVRSGAVTWMTSVPARPETASLATSVTTASAVGARRQHGQRPVHLEPELSHRPDRVVLLHLGDGDPRGLALGRIVQHRRCTPGVLGGEPGHLLVHRRQGLHFPLRRLRFPGGQPLRLGGLGGAGLPGDGAARFGLGAPGVLRRLLAEQPDRPLGRRLAVRLLVLADQGLQFRGQRPGPGAEQVHHVLADPADLGAVAVRPRHHGVPQRGQPGLHHPVGHRGDREPLVVQAAGIQRAPFLVGPSARCTRFQMAMCTCRCGSPSRLM